MKMIKVEAGIVTSVIVRTDATTVDEGYIPYVALVGIGWEFIGGVAIEPEPEESTD